MLGIYDYTDNGKPDAIVRTDSPEFQSILAYLDAHGPHEVHWLLEYTGSEWGDAESPESRHVTRCAVVFQSGQLGAVGAVFAAHDAYLVQQSPEITLAELFPKWGQVAPEPLPKYADFNAPAVDPVGYLRAGYSNIWDVSAAWNEATWPMGSTFKKRYEGRDMIFYRTSVKQGADYVAAWTDKPNP
jgi:hypothetical protein